MLVESLCVTQIFPFFSLHRRRCCLLFVWAATDTSKWVRATKTKTPKKDYEKCTSHGYRIAAAAATVHGHVAYMRRWFFERNALSICAYQFFHSINNNDLTSNGAIRRWYGTIHCFQLKFPFFYIFPIRNRVPCREEPERPFIRLFIFLLQLHHLYWLYCPQHTILIII